jgi:hypothetical protein
VHRRGARALALAIAVAGGLLASCRDDQPLGARGPSAGGPAARAVTTAAVDVFIHGHQDDWQLFMGDRVAAALPGDDHVVLVYATAGDAGNDTAYWHARERAAQASADSLAGAGAWACAVQPVNAHALRRCAKGKVVAYYLRLPDGNSDGLGFGHGSMELLRDQGTALAAMDGSTAYATWGDLTGTLRALVELESGGLPEPRVHAPDWDRALNPGDHADHSAVGDAVKAAGTGAGWSLWWYADYNISTRPANLSAADVALKTRYFRAYDDVMNAGGFGTLLAQQGYQSWLARTYRRAEVAPLPPPAPTGSTFATDFSPYAAGPQPAGWSQQWDPAAFWKVVTDPSATGGQLLEWNSVGASRNRWGLSFDGFGDVGDQSVLTDFRVRSLGGGTSLYYLGSAAVRMGGTAPDEHGYALYFVDNQAAGVRSVVLATWAGGAYQQLADLPLSWEMNAWYKVRLVATGGHIRARVWPRDVLEPGAWGIDAFDTRYPSGRPGVANHDNGVMQWDTWSVDVSPAPPPPVGQTWVTTFSAGAGWTAPAGWTATSAPGNMTWQLAPDPSVPDGRVLRAVAGNIARHILRFDSVPDATTDEEVLTRFRMGDDDGYGPGLAVRHTMSGGAENAYVAYLRSGTGEIEIDRFVGGAWGWVGAAPFPNTPGTWYWMRFAAIGSSLRAKVWADGTPEPGGWTVQTGDGSLGAGSVGVYLYEPNTVDFDAFSAATQGGTAPTPSAGPPPATLAQVVAKPDSSSATSGATVQLAGYGVLANGDSVPVSLSWTGTGGTVSAAGTYTAGSAAGTYRAIATVQGGTLADTVKVVVTAAPPAPLSQVWSTTFGGDAVGAQPAGWTASSAPFGSAWTVEADATASDGKVLRGATTVTARHIFRADNVNVDGGEQEALVKIKLDAANGYGPGLAVRHRMTNGSESAYVLYLRPAAGEIEMDRFLNGGWMFMTSTHFASSTNTWYWMRFRASGSMMQGKVWADGTPEPSGWMVIGVDSAIPTGALGVYTYEPANVSFDGFTGVSGPATAPAP